MTKIVTTFAKISIKEEIETLTNSRKFILSYRVSKKLNKIKSLDAILIRI